MKKLLILLLIGITTFSNADVNSAVDNFFNTLKDPNISVNGPAIVQQQSAGIISGGGIAMRSQVVNLQPMSFTPPSFNTSCGNMNFYSGSLAFMTNTDQLVGFLQNTLMTAGITAVITALKAATPNIAGTVQSMFDAAQKMLGMFNNSCQLGMALGNATDSWMYERLAKAKAQAHGDSSDASDAEINSTTGGGSSTNLAANMNKIADTYHNWVNKNASMNPNDASSITNDIATKYGSVIWKGIQALHLYNLPVSSGSANDVASIANLVISLTGDLIIYSPANDGTGTAARTIPPSILDVNDFMTNPKANSVVYNCTYFSTINPGECTQGDLSTLVYPTTSFNGGIVATIQTAMNDIQKHFVDQTPLTDNDMLIISISPIPIFAIAQALDDIGMTGSISNFLNLYSPQIAFEILQSLINTSLQLAIQASETRNNAETAQSISNFVNSITGLQHQVNSYATLYVKEDPVKILQELNYLKSYAQNQMSPQIMQKVAFAKQLGSY